MVRPLRLRRPRRHRLKLRTLFHLPRRLLARYDQMT
jgi:hypothetical protein